MVISNKEAAYLNIPDGTFISEGKNAVDGAALLYYEVGDGGNIRITKGTFKSANGKWAIIARPYYWKADQTMQDIANTLLYKGKYAKSYSLETDEYGRIIFRSKTVKVKKK